MIEHKILAHLLYNEEYSRKILPFIQEEYFQQEKNIQTVFRLIRDYYSRYNRPPTKEALYIDLSKIEHKSELAYKESQAIINQLEADPNTSTEWLIEQTEEFCKNKAVYNAILESIQIFDGKSNASKHSIPEILTKALGVGFDTHVGHDFIDDAYSRWEFYTKKEVKIPFDLDYFNRITNGGVSKKTLNVFLAATGVGKSLFMCHMAAANLMAGYNVLYITLEMSEERIAERIDANLLDVSMTDLREITQESYQSKIEQLNGRLKNGRLVIKEYPTATASSASFRHLMNELRLKKNFVPDILYIDYLNICSSARLKASQSASSYTYIKAIAEELRGLAGEFDIPIISATQANRSGLNNSDIDLSNTSESIGLPQTCDLMLALISSEEMERQNQILVKQLKNRYYDPTKYKRFVVGINRDRMRLFDVEQQDMSASGDDPVFDQTDMSKLEDKFRNNKMGEFI